MRFDLDGMGGGIATFLRRKLDKVKSLVIYLLYTRSKNRVDRSVVAACDNADGKLGLQ